MSPVVVIGCGMAGHSRRHPPQASRTAVRRSSRRTQVPAGRGGRTATRGHGSTLAAISTAIRSSHPITGPSSTAGSPNCWSTSPASSRNTICGRTAGSTPPSKNCDGMTSTLRWSVHVSGPNGTEEVIGARFVVSAVGSLNIPKLPDIPGMKTFGGPSFHSARWPHGLDLTGKRFALVGAGASGFQIGPAIAGDVEQLTIFQRTAQWIIPNPLYHAAVPPGDRWALRHLPFYGRWYRFIMTFGGIAAGAEPYRVEPGYEDQTSRSVNAVNATRADALARLDEVDHRRAARPGAEGRARLPGSREACPAG